MNKFIIVMLSFNLMFLTSNLLYSQKSNSQVRMKLVGYYNGDTKDIRTNEDWKQEGKTESEINFESQRLRDSSLSHQSVTVTH